MKGNMMEITNDAQDGFGPSEMVQALQITVERLTNDLEESRNAHTARIESLKEDHQEQLDRMSKLTRTRENQRLLTEHALESLRQLAIRQMNTIGEVDQATREDEFYLRTVERAFKIALVLGYRSEARQLADELDHRDIFDSVAEDESLRIESEHDRYTKIREIVYRATSYPDSERHPMSAEYQSLWREAYKVAKQTGLCDEYERVCKFLGIPTDFELSWSGTVRVYVDGWFEFDTSGDASYGTPDASEELDNVNIGDYIDQLDITAEFTNLNFED